MISGSAVAEIDLYEAPGEVYILLRGRIVLEDCERLRSITVPILNKGAERAFVDLSAVDYIDSAGLGLLVGLKMTAKKNNARIIVLQPSKPVADILYISKLDGIFEVVTGSEAAAIRSRLVQPEFSASGGGGASAGASAPGGGAPGAAPPEWLQSRLDTAFPDSPRGGDGSDSADGKEVVEEHCRKAVEFMRQGNYEMSVEEYKNALAVDGDYLPALNNLAIVYEKQPSWNAMAIEQWEKVLALSKGRGDQKHQDRASRHLANLRKMQS